MELHTGSTGGDTERSYEYTKDVPSRNGQLNRACNTKKADPTECGDYEFFQREEVSRAAGN